MEKLNEDEVTDMAKPRGRPFAPGNTAGSGRPLGSRNKGSLAAQALFAEHSELLTRKCIFLAMQGDRIALPLCMERVCPPIRDTPSAFQLPVVRALDDLLDAANTVTQAISQGELTPEQGLKVMDLLEKDRTFLVAVEDATRRKAIEELTGTDLGLEP
jgi:hypothetical protein